MKKKIVLTLFMLALLICTLSITALAKDVYLEPLPEELVISDTDTVTHLVVFEEEKYFTGNATQINGLNTEQMESDMTAAGIDATKIGTEYLIRYNFPATLNGNQLSTINVNAFKANATYFSGKCAYLQFPSTITSITDMNGHTSSLRCLDFGENSQVASIPYLFCPNASNMMAIKNFPRNLTSIGGSAFNGCYRGFKGELYINAKTIDASAFSNSVAHVTKLILGPDVESIGNQTFCVRMAELSTTVRPADDLIQIREIEFQCKVSDVSIDSGAFYFGGTWARSPYIYLEKISLTHVEDEAKVVDGVSIFYDFTSNNAVVPFDGTDGSGYFVSTAHAEEENGGIDYENGFLEAGKRSYICSRCKATLRTETTEPLFICRGYSVSELEDVCGVMIGYKINKGALDLYTEVTGRVVRYGVYAASQTKLGENDIFGDDGVATSGVTALQMSQYDIIAFEIKIMGFELAEHKATKLAMGGYVYETDSDGFARVSYLEQDEPSEGEKYSFVTYNELSYLLS